MVGQPTVDTTISSQWYSRGAEERFTSLPDMHSMMVASDRVSRSAVASSRALSWAPDPNPANRNGLVCVGKAGVAYAPSHWAFGQACQRAEAPAGYLRTLPAPMAADCLNYGYKIRRDVEDVGLYLEKAGGTDGVGTLKAVTGPRYGRIHNSEIVGNLIDRFGDGVTGDWRVPGEFGVAVRKVTKENTTLYASDRDMFVFLADETNRITIPNRRDGKSGTLARGFYISNSEVGAGTLTLGMYLFDYACMNRILWGVQDFTKISIRHSAGAPDRYIENVVPAIKQLAHTSAAPIEAMLKGAQERKVDALESFLKNRFTSAEVTGMKLAYQADEGRPLADKEGTASLWDITTAATAYARDLKWQNDRVDLEKRAGALLELV